jgi:hypothetical protein
LSAIAALSVVMPTTMAVMMVVEVLDPNQLRSAAREESGPTHALDMVSPRTDATLPGKNRLQCKEM